MTPLTPVISGQSRQTALSVGPGSYFAQMDGGEDECDATKEPCCCLDDDFPVGRANNSVGPLALANPPR